MEGERQCECGNGSCEWWTNADKRCVCGSHGCIWGNNKDCEVYAKCEKCENPRSETVFCPAEKCVLCGECCVFDNRCEKCGAHCEGMVEENSGEDKFVCCDCHPTGYDGEEDQGFEDEEDERNSPKRERPEQPVEEPPGAPVKKSGPVIIISPDTEAKRTLVFE